MRFPAVCLGLFVLLMGPAAGPPAACAQDKDEKTVRSPDATVYVDGLSCPFCAYGLEKKMNKLNALRKMEVQLEKGRVLLAFKDGETLTKEQIQKAVKQAGFTARKIEFAEEAPSEGVSPPDATDT